jgi:hypothetical protein
MDHAEAIEHIELAAVEPGGLERLMAGDTPEGAAVAGHLAGCPACVDQLARIRRTSVVVREIVATAPDPALRERTLAFVRAVGRDRPSIADAGTGPVAATDDLVPAGAAVALPEPAAVAGHAPSAAMGRRWLRLGAIAAAIVLAAGLGYGLAVVRSPEPALQREVAVLEYAARDAMVVGSQPDAQRIALASTGASDGATGSLVFSPSTGELVMVADGLLPLGPGEEYGCWVETGGTRTRIGRMYPAGGMHAWAGPVDGLAELPADAVFGVSRVPADGGVGEPVLTGGG